MSDRLLYPRFENRCMLGSCLRFSRRWVFPMLPDTLWHSADLQVFQTWTLDFSSFAGNRTSVPEVFSPQRSHYTECGIPAALYHHHHHHHHLHSTLAEYGSHWPNTSYSHLCQNTSDCTACVWLYGLCLRIRHVSDYMACVWVYVMCLSICHVSDSTACVWVYGMCLTIWHVSEYMSCVWLYGLCLSMRHVYVYTACVKCYCLLH
jgi:hypothetical protein